MNAWHRLKHRVGRRGSALLFLALVDLAYSWGLYVPLHPLSPVNMYLDGIGTLWFWGTLWGITGIICIIAAFRRQDRFGFAAASLLKVFWALMNFAAAIFGHVPRAGVSAAIWLCLSGWIYIISTWPEYVRPPKPKGSPGG
jgi:hypothetical protein